MDGVVELPGLDRDEHRVRRPRFRCVRHGPHRDGERLAGARHFETARPQCIEVRAARDERHVRPRGGELAPEIAADPPAPTTVIFIVRGR